MRRYFHDIVIAVESLVANKLKSILTVLGIIFGVAAVISMLAIGKGAKQEILEQIYNLRKLTLYDFLNQRDLTADFNNLTE